MNEIVYLIFLLSGILKVFLIYFNIPTGIDITLLSAFFLLLLMIRNLNLLNFKLRVNRFMTYSSSILFIIFFLILFSLFYTSSQYYVYVKTFGFIAILIAFLFPFFIKSFSIFRFFRLYIILITFLSIVFIPIFLISYELFMREYVAMQSNIGLIIYQSYLSMGYFMGLAIILVAFSSIFQKKHQILIASILFISLVITGARGPIVSVVIIILFFFAHNKFRLKKPKFKTVIIISFMSIFIIGYTLYAFDITEVLSRTMDRLFALSNVTTDSASNDRLERFSFVFDSMNMTNIVFGHGFGSFGFEQSGIDRRSYPHNILLEFLFELGLFGLILYLFYIGFIVKKLFLQNDFLLWAIFIYLFLNSMKSLSIVDSRLMFGFFAIILMSKKNYLKSYK